MEQRLGRYEILELIASGAQGSVYRAFDPESGEIVALKVPTATGNPAYSERFRREARLAASVDHPNVIRILEVGEENGRQFMAMDYLPNSLASVIQSGGALEIGRAAGFAMQIAEGLGAAHSLGIVHRDVKPQNVLLGEDGTAKVTDFGIARADILTTMTATGAMMGTPHYMSPEQARGEHAEIRSEIYSLGCLLYQMLTGELPFKGETPLAVVRQQIEEQPTPVRQLRPDVPLELAVVVERAMDKDADKRFHSGSEMASALRKAIPRLEALKLKPASVAAPPELEPLVERRRPKARRLLYVAAVGVVLASIAAAATVPLLFFRTQGGATVSQKTPSAVREQPSPPAAFVGAVASGVVIVPVVPGKPTTLVSPEQDVIIAVDAGSVDIAVNLEYKQLTPEQVPDLPKGFGASGKVFDLTTSMSVGQAPSEFGKPLTITARLSAEDLAMAGGTASNLVIMHLHSGDDTWSLLATTVDFDAMTAIAQVNSLSLFALAIKEQAPSPTPVPPSATPTPTVGAEPLPVPTDTPMPTATATATPTDTPAPTPTSTAVPPIATPTPPGVQPTATSTATSTPTSVPPTPTDTPTSSLLPTATATPMPSLVPVPTDTPVPARTATPGTTDTLVPRTLTVTVEPTPTATLEPTPTATVEPTPTARSARRPTATVEPTPTATLEPTPTATLEPTATPTQSGGTLPAP